MRFNHITLCSLASLALSAMANAGVTERPGSLLVFHEFDNRNGVANLITVTNTNDDQTPIGTTTLARGTIDVEFIYRGRVGHNDTVLECLEFNRTRRLTPNDTISILTKNDNPNQVQGYLYAFAKGTTSPVSGKPVKFDWLIGNNLVIDGLASFDYSVNPFVYQSAITGANDGTRPTDTDGPGGMGDGIRDLDGDEYVGTPEQILIPRFIGQSSTYDSDLVLINLTGGTQFSTVLDFLIYNDNEEVFSAQHQFRCWEKVHLLDVSGVFANDFLLDNTNHNPNEIPGANYVKTGWIRIDGNTAFSSSTQFSNPAFLAVLVEKVSSYKAADLPFGTAAPDNLTGDLLPQSIMGDTTN